MVDEIAEQIFSIDSQDDFEDEVTHLDHKLLFPKSDKEDTISNRTKEVLINGLVIEELFKKPVIREPQKHNHFNLSVDDELIFEISSLLSTHLDSIPFPSLNSMEKLSTGWEVTKKKDLLVFAMDYKPRNYRVHISMADWECPFTGHITNDMLHQVFNTSNYQKRSVKMIIREEILFPQASKLLFPSQLVSIFLSNAMDLLQSLDSLEHIAKRVQTGALFSEHGAGTWQVHNNIQDCGLSKSFDSISLAIDKINLHGGFERLYYSVDSGSLQQGSQKQVCHAFYIL
ncbi:hypothetical protein SUGI_0486700 [Cryptomeria japonica]|nr:hypothetical protein SUGI_0486700 [Cryptomeria japonica]